MSGVKTTYSPVMKPVLATVVSSRPAVWSPYASASMSPSPRPASTPARGVLRKGRQANGPNTALERKPRCEEGEQRNVSSACWTGTNVIPQHRRDEDEGERGCEHPHRPDRFVTTVKGPQRRLRPPRRPQGRLFRPVDS